MSQRYPIPAGRTRVEDDIKNSRFITTLAYTPSEASARKFIAEVREEFPDANHNCWAYVVGPPGTTRANGASDDGEPGGTAGRPMLAVLLGCGLGDVSAVVTRYFGGTKLGRGGLVRAYGGGVQHALRVAERGEHVPMAAVALMAPYACVDPIRRVVAEFGAEIVGETFGEHVGFEVRIAADRVTAFETAVTDATSGAARVTRAED